MLRSIILSVFAIAFVALPVRAADLPAHSRLGAVFAEPSEAAALADRSYDTPVVVHVPYVALRPLGGGYYGRPNSYEYSAYYGSSFDAWAFRLPYACGLYGYC
jgi:hypothetical protein